MILVTGVTGNAGRETAKNLIKEGFEVKGLIRRKEQAGLLEKGVKEVIGDLDDPDSLNEAFKNVTSAFLLPGFKDMPAVYSAAKKAGIKHIVQLSGRSAESEDTSNAITDYMVKTENAARGSEVDWTIVRPSAFMTNALRWAPQVRDRKVVRLPFANVLNAYIDPYDIGNMVAAIIKSPEKHVRQTYNLSGPESLSPEDCVRTVAKVLERDLGFEAQSNEAARVEMLAQMPEKYVNAFFNFYVDGVLDESEILPTVKEITGEQPRRFENWVYANRGAFEK